MPENAHDRRVFGCVSENSQVKVKKVMHSAVWVVTFMGTPSIKYVIMKASVCVYSVFCPPQKAWDLMGHQIGNIKDQTLKLL